MLSERLRQLRRQAGAEPAAPAVLPSADAPSLADRIARASIRRGTASRLDDAGLAERLGGELVAAGVIELRHRFALGQPPHRKPQQQQQRDDYKYGASGSHADPASRSIAPESYLCLS